ncbi:hypothetical protein P280DRAFT_477626 [Massarina eburnea CBS 473.64]|uniref:Uncharacterized protein n=1 Tax=Massarina eburnea CBS 473.64 TaxID=1395130 RepID=A0A6A6S928_9PLEO|nr:hypothetical protein P280DRAFT_477626 [Massarina eburnea CBS 473.64]
MCQSHANPHLSRLLSPEPSLFYHLTQQLTEPVHWAGYPLLATIRGSRKPKTKLVWGRGEEISQLPCYVARDGCVTVDVWRQDDTGISNEDGLGRSRECCTTRNGPDERSLGYFRSDGVHAQPRRPTSLSLSNTIAPDVFHDGPNSPPERLTGKPSGIVL